jgi:hypothetical protein
LKEVMHILLAAQSNRFYCNVTNMCSAVTSVLNAQELWKNDVLVKAVLVGLQQF